MNWTLLKNYLPTILISAFSLVILIQLIYHLCIFSRLAFFKKKSRIQAQQYPVSVIICARDESKNITQNLPNVLLQEYTSTREVIVVNDNSIDDSKYILQELQSIFKVLTVIELTQEAKLINGKKYPLSIGIKEAKHEILLLTDADCVPASELWIQKMQEGYHNGVEVVLGYSGYQKKPGMLNKLIRFETFHAALQYLSYALAGIPYMGVGRNLSYKKDVFFRNKGFSSINHIPGGDDDLFINKVATKANTEVVLDPKAFTLSTPKTSFSAWMKQKQRHYSTARYYKLKHKFLLGLYSFTQFLTYPLFIVTAIMYDWQIALSILILKLSVQGLVYCKAMRKLHERDLWPFYILFDLWMFFYYIIFSPMLWKKPRAIWM